MTVRINGAARGGEFISNNLQFYNLYTNINIEQTGNYQDATQKDFDSIVQMIAMFSQVIISNDPVNVADLNANGAPTLTGAGYVFKFANNAPDGANALTISPNASDGITYAGSSTDDKDLINTKATSKQGDFVVIASLDGTTAWQVTQVRGTFAKES